MRRFFEAVARALRGRRELAVAAATAIIAALIAGGQATLAAIVAAGAAGLMAGRAERYRLAARDARRQAEELREELIENGAYATAEAARHRVEVAAWHRRLEALAKEAREHLASLKRNYSSYCWYAPHREWELKRADRQLAKAPIPMREQVQLIDILPKEDVDEFYAENEEVNTTTAAEEE